MSPRAQLAFDAYTAVDPSTGKASAANAPAGFLGAGGGFAAAIALRAMTHTVPDQTRAPRALTLRLLAPMRTHLTVAVTPTIDRIGRSTTATSVQLDQEATTVARAPQYLPNPAGACPDRDARPRCPTCPDQRNVLLSAWTPPAEADLAHTLSVDPQAGDYRSPARHTRGCSCG